MKEIRKITLMLIIIIIVQVLIPVLSIIWQNRFTTFSIAADEEGEKEYYINTAQDLWNFAEKVNSGDNFQGKTVYLNNDIDLNGNENKQWISINRFRGTFEGNGHTIKGLFIKNNGENRGLFLSNEGYIRNLNLDNAHIDLSESKGNIGLVCARNYGEIINCKVINSEINYTGTSGVYVGGICGYNSGIIDYCENEADIYTR